ncbi:quinone-dependent dihydroorotate dehydrogenase [Hoeflea poritis]|uniref:Dihydroorotate dehydrogenase (quinone) n=1 Tax=Hoeflea poritis TaxID=2993659 RepID=A0ABT4VTP3_9HYPH|nr:quinone-dependent dihydroorotate dehydrogenase [Hoeflea poritis]MDA4848069.1 quinone-dependent dihydroorotate dehydrogenase [Hoeflea poritis]
MTHPLYRLARHALFALDPETAHRLSIKALKSGALPPQTADADPGLAVDAAGLRFKNPIGIAAGFDKNAEVANEVLRLGFGFTEIGSVTPLPQAGNPQPRIFRLPADRAVINRLGFNNEGHAAALRRLRGSTGPRPGPIGVNVGANKDSEDRIGDYALGITVFYDVADYFTVNVSSPNTPGLRDLQARENLMLLISAVQEARSARQSAGAEHKPIFVKIAPDLNEEDLRNIASVARETGLDGLIVSNTTLSRDGLRAGRHTGQSGGLSGRPLFERSTIVLAKLRALVGPQMTLIGLGGVDSAQTALEKIRAGADLVQLYTGFVYEGPGIVPAILSGLSRAVSREGIGSIADLRDSHLDAWAERSIPQ